MKTLIEMCFCTHEWVRQMYFCPATSQKAVFEPQDEHDYIQSSYCFVVAALNNPQPINMLKYSWAHIILLISELNTYLKCYH